LVRREGRSEKPGGDLSVKTPPRFGAKCVDAIPSLEICVAAFKKIFSRTEKKTATRGDSSGRPRTSAYKLWLCTIRRV
jgi:hypothetical protein